MYEDMKNYLEIWERIERSRQKDLEAAQQMHKSPPDWNAIKKQVLASGGRIIPKADWLKEQNKKMIE